MPGPASVEIRLTADEQAQLAAWAAGAETGSLAVRAAIVLACAEGKSNTRIADEQEVSRPTVVRWRHRFAERRLAGLSELPRRGPSPQAADAQVQRVIQRTLETPPPAGERWSTRTLAEALGVSQSTVSRTWRRYGVQPPRRSNPTRRGEHGSGNDGATGELSKIPDSLL